MSKLKKWMQEPSTKKGIGLLAAGATLAIGQPELINMAISDDGGLKIGGIAGLVYMFGLSIWEMYRNESRDK